MTAATTATKNRPAATKFAQPAPKPRLPAKPAQRAKPQGTALAKAEPPAPPANMLQAIMRAAADPKVDADKMRQLLDMAKEVRAEDARLAFLAAFRELRREMPIIDENGRIKIEGKQGKRGQDTPFAKWIDIQNGMHALLDKHGFTLSHRVEPGADPSRINVVSELSHVAGHAKSSTFPLPAEVSGSKNNVQGWGSARSFGKRYNTVDLLDIRSRAPEERDLNGFNQDDVEAANRAIDAAQLDTLTKAIEFCGVGIPAVLEKYKIEKLDDLPAARLKDALSACKRYADTKAAKVKDPS